eukprot:6922313-Prymnesium_polylepis.1
MISRFTKIGTAPSKARSCPNAVRALEGHGSGRGIVFLEPRPKLPSLALRARTRAGQRDENEAVWSGKSVRQVSLLRR